TASEGGDEDIPVPAQDVCVHAEGLKTTRGGEGPCDDGPRACCLLLATTASAPRTALLSPLNTSPVRAPVYASRTASQQCPAHDSGGSVDRYSFTVTDLHRLPPAGLPAHRGSMAGLCPPLPTLRRRPRGRQRMRWSVSGLRPSFVRLVISAMAPL